MAAALLADRLIDLKSEQGKAVLADLIARTDVLMENFRPGVMAANIAIWVLHLNDFRTLRRIGPAKGDISSAFIAMNRGKRSIVDLSMLDSTLAFNWPDAMYNHVWLDDPPHDLRPLSPTARSLASIAISCSS
jgi:CoA-transferase family III